MDWNYGIHKGKPISSIPTNYLVWFLSSDGREWASPKIKHRVMALNELSSRGLSVELKCRANILAMKKILTNNQTKGDE